MFFFGFLRIHDLDNLAPFRTRFCDERAAGWAARGGKHQRRSPQEQNMNKASMRLVIGAPAAFGLSSACAQLEIGGDLLDNCAEIDALSRSGDYAQARDKARLCLDGLEEKVQGQVGEFFLPETP